MKGKVLFVAVQSGNSVLSKCIVSRKRAATNLSLKINMKMKWRSETSYIALDAEIIAQIISQCNNILVAKKKSTPCVVNLSKCEGMVELILPNRSIQRSYIIAENFFASTRSLIPLVFSHKWITDYILVHHMYVSIIS